MNKLCHIAIIMDGNGRWAKARNLPRIEGHKQGLVTAETIINFCLQRGIRYISLYVFSTENWKRPKVEINALFALADKYLDKFKSFCEKGIRVVVSGERQSLPKKLVNKISQIEHDTQYFDSICVNLCINYGGQKDIEQSVKYLVDNNIEISTQNIQNHLYNAFIPCPDLIVRTGGQKRLSNFLLFQSAYSELFFVDTLWPDFSITELNGIINNYELRTRNFGGIVDDK